MGLGVMIAWRNGINFKKKNGFEQKEWDL